jgi:hypothetical protein
VQKLVGEKVGIRISSRSVYIYTRNDDRLQLIVYEAYTRQGKASGTPPIVSRARKGNISAFSAEKRKFSSYAEEKHLTLEMRRTSAQATWILLALALAGFVQGGRPATDNDR